MELDKAIQSRKSVRKFKMAKPDWRDIIECIDFARYAPASGKNFTLRFILVDNSETIAKIAEASEQNFISQAHYVVVFVNGISRLKNSFGSQGEVYARQQAGAAIENFLLKLHEKGLATCWIGHFSEEQIKRELKIPGGVNVEAVFPIGYSNEDSKASRKTDLDKLMFFNTYGNRRMKKPKGIEF